MKTFDDTLLTLIVKKNFLFEIPNYQRHYVWTEKEVLLFLNDGRFCMEKYRSSNKKFEHYAGQMIFRKLEEKRDGRIRLEVIDGQQRLTTFMLLVIVVTEQLRGLQSDRSGELREKYLLSRSDMDPSEWEARLKLSRRDSDFWENLQAGSEVCKTAKLLESQVRLLEAQETIRTFLTEMTEGMETSERIDTLANLVDDLADSFRIVVLMSEDAGQEFALFQIVNDRGLPLTAGELLKARTIELLTSQDKAARRERIIKEAETIWADILQDDGVTTEKFLVWNYIAMLGKKPESTKKISIREQYERDIFDCLNQREISMDAQDVMLEQLKQLLDNVRRCRPMERGEFPIKCDNENMKLMFGILISNMKNTFAIPIYLQLLCKHREKDVIRIAETLTPMLAKTYFQAKSMGNLADESVQKCYLEIWNKVGEEKVSIDGIRECLEKLLNKGKCREEFQRKIEQDIYERNTGNFKSKFLLLMAELQCLKEGENSKKDVGDDSVTIVFDKLSVEHILHKGIPADEVSSDLYASIHKIGNLTLLGQKRNSREKAKSFEDKKEHYLLSPFVITRKVGELNEWKLREFRERQAEMRGILERAFVL